MRAVRSIPLAIISIMALSGCAGAPDGTPIVLRKPAPAPRVVKRAGPPKATVSGPVRDETVPLTGAEKEALFQQFDTFLQQAGPPK